MAEPISINFGILILQTMKVLILYLMGKSGGKGWFVVRLGRHKTHNGWYLEMVVPISSIRLGLLILYSKNIVGQ